MSSFCNVEETKRQQFIATCNFLSTIIFYIIKRIILDLKSLIGHRKGSFLCGAIRNKKNILTGNVKLLQNCKKFGELSEFVRSSIYLYKYR